jgi:hypothetical protein
MFSVGGADLLGLKPLAPTGHGSLIAQGLIGLSPGAGGGHSMKPSPSRAHSSMDGQPPVEEATKKREIRLLKNR